MKPAAEEMKAKIDKTNFKKTSIDIVNNVKANVENDPNETKKLYRSNFSTVRWRESTFIWKKLV